MEDSHCGWFTMANPMKLIRWFRGTPILRNHHVVLLSVFIFGGCWVTVVISSDDFRSLFLVGPSAERSPWKRMTCPQEAPRPSTGSKLVCKPSGSIDMADMAVKNLTPFHLLVNPAYFPTTKSHNKIAISGALFADITMVHPDPPSHWIHAWRQLQSEAVFISLIVTS